MHTCVVQQYNDRIGRGLVVVVVVEGGGGGHRVSVRV